MGIGNKKVGVLIFRDPVPFTLTATHSHFSLWRGNAFVLDRLPFNLSPKDLWLLKGPNGCGKSSLLKAMAGLLPLDPPVEYAGVAPPLYLAADAIPTSPMTIREWVTFFYELLPPEHRFKSPIETSSCVLSEVLSVWHLDPDMPLRLLSAGQKQRLALCRLLYQKSPLWLLDEPTQHLDTQGIYILTDVLQKHCQWGAAVIADHTLVTTIDHLKILDLTPYTQRPHVSL